MEGFLIHSLQNITLTSNIKVICSGGHSEEEHSPDMYELMPKSPGLSKNQNLKDRVFQDVFNRKINDLKSTKLLYRLIISPQPTQPHPQI